MNRFSSLSAFAMLLLNGATGVFVPAPQQQLSIPRRIIGGETFMSSRRRSSSRGTRLYYYFCDPKDEGNNKKKTNGNKNDEKDNDPVAMELEELERARSSFEALVFSSLSSLESGAILNTATPQQQQQQPPLLTSAGRRIRELEMDLLRSLEESDVAIEKLVYLWATERDETAAADLLAMQTKCSEGLVEERAKLLDMSRQYPDWAEPYARLTTLYYFLGQPAEAVDTAEKALELKPWHFEVLQMTILLATMRHHHENNNNANSADDITIAKARILARQAMPSLQAKVDRKNWVARALTQAFKQLQEAEKAAKAVQQYKLVAELSEDQIWQ